MLAVSRLYTVRWEDDRLMINSKGSGSCHGLTKVLSCHLPARTEKTMKVPLRIASVLAEIRTKHLPNTSLEGYLYTILFSICHGK
jgi:hypothetical protein